MTDVKVWRMRLSALGLFGALLVSAACGSANASSGANNNTTSAPAGTSANVVPTGTADPGSPGAQSTPYGGSGIAPTPTPLSWGYPTPTPGPVTPRAAVYFLSANAMLALNLDTGALLWKHNLTGSFVPSDQPVVQNGLVYFTDYNQNLEALDAHTGNLVWKNTTYYSEYSPLVTSTGVYLLSGATLVDFDPHSGKVLWMQTAKSPFGTPIFGNNKVWVAETPDNSTMTFNPFDPATGQPGTVVTFTGIAFPDTPVQMVNGRVYFRCQDNVNLCAADLTTGTLLWQVNEKYIVTRIAYGNGMLYFQTYNGFLGVNATNGQTVFNAGHGSTSGIEGSQLAQIANGYVYAALNGTYYSFNATTGKQQWSASGTTGEQGQIFDGIIAAPGVSVVALNASNGAHLWIYHPRGSTDEVVIASW